MKRPKPPYLIYKVRNGRTDWYYWKRPGPQVRITGEYGSREFWQSYEAAALNKATPSIQKPTENLSWLLDRYRESADWRKLSEGTREVRDRIFHRILKANPSVQYGAIDRPMILQTRDSYQDTPGTANTFMGAVSGLFKWAVLAGFVENNPTLGVGGVKKPKTEGFRQWTHEDMAAFKDRWPIGTRERLAFEILINTGLRRGDASRLGKQHIRQGRLRITTQKTGTLINIPVSDHLLAVIDQSPTGDLVLIPSQHGGGPMRPLSYGNWFREAAKAAGVNGSPHGLRKAAASALAEAGATVPELNAVFGWQGSAMAMHYIEKANREKLADNAAAKLGKSER
jgi:integrase